MQTALITAQPPEGAQGDTKLLVLGEMLDLAWKVQTLLCDQMQADETDAKTKAWEQAYDRTQAIVYAIEETPAQSIDGLRVKARAVAWCHSGEPSIQLGESATDERLASQILNALLSPTVH